MKKLGKKLTLNKETVRELTDSELGQVAGAKASGDFICIDTRRCTWVRCNSVSQTSCICASGAGNGCVTEGCCNTMFGC